MWVAITNSRATVQQLCDNLRYLSFYMDFCESDSETFHQLFDANSSACIARNKTVGDPIALFVDGFFAEGNHVFVK